jgi:hypothetical protein
MMKLIVVLTALVLTAVVVEAQAPSQAPGQQRPVRPNRPAVQGRAQILDDAGGVTPVEIQRMFDAYALIQAQEQLRLNDEQYARFLVRYKALQDTRRQAIQEHTRLVNELRRLLMEQRQADDGELKEQMRALQDADARAVSDVRKVFEGVDQVLDVRQQAMFRVFEEQMERRKLELVTRARQANRANQPR